MVVTSAPSAWTASVVQDFTAVPFRWMTHAPHWLVSQPTWVPVSPRWVRSISTSKVRASTSAETSLPFTFNETVGIRLSSGTAHALVRNAT